MVENTSKAEYEERDRERERRLATTPVDPAPHTSRELLVELGISALGPAVTDQPETSGTGSVSLHQLNCPRCLNHQLNTARDCEASTIIEEVCQRTPPAARYPLEEQFGGHANDMEHVLL